MRHTHALAPAALALVIQLGSVGHSMAATADTISVFEFGSNRITSEDAPVLVHVSETQTLSLRTKFELTESVTGDGAPELTFRVVKPVAVQFADWEIPSDAAEIITFSPGVGGSIGVGSYNGKVGAAGVQLTLRHTYPAFSGAEDQGPWLAGDFNFTIETLERDSSGHILSFSATYSSEYLSYWRNPYSKPGVTGSIQYNMPTAVPEANALALALSGFAAVGFVCRRKKQRIPS